MFTFLINPKKYYMEMSPGTMGDEAVVGKDVREGTLTLIQDEHKVSEELRNNVVRIQEFINRSGIDKQIIEEVNSYIEQNAALLFSKRGKDGRVLEKGFVMKESLEALANIQIQLGSLMALIQMNYNFAEYSGGMNFYKIAVQEIAQHGDSNPTEVCYVFPQIVDDAMEVKSKYLSGLEKGVVTDVTDYILDRVLECTGFTELNVSKITGKRAILIEFADRARTTVERRFTTGMSGINAVEARYRGESIAEMNIRKRKEMQRIQEIVFSQNMSYDDKIEALQEIVLGTKRKS